MNTDYKVDAFLAAFLVLQTEIRHRGRQLRYLAVQEARQSQLLQLFFGLNESAPLQTCMKIRLKGSRGKPLSGFWRGRTHAFICGVGEHSYHWRLKEGWAERHSGLPKLCPTQLDGMLEQMGALDRSFVSWR